ncbi:MAG: hypothetical protein ACRDJG_02875 [Actinomycetota bacterium]
MVCLAICLTIAGPAADARATGTPITYKAFKYPSSVESPTYDMAQAKLWHHDGAWWAALSSPAKDGIHLYELMADHSWRDTGAIVDPRPTGRADVLWDGAKLYVATATHSTEVSLARLSYDKAARTYRMDAGFPVAITRGGALTASIAKDSLGVLWAVFIQGAKVLVTHTAADDAHWIPPFEPPGPRAHPTKAHDAMASIVAFNQMVGIMWTNPDPGTFRFATHQDGAPDSAWSKVEDALSRVGSNDHVSLRAIPGDPQGRIYAAVKTSRRTPRDPPDAPGIMLLVRDRNGAWSRYPVSSVSENQTRPQLLLDPEGATVYVFSSTYLHRDTIFYKSASMDAPSFEGGPGSPFLKVPGAGLNNITTTKQIVDATTGIVAMSGANSNRTYYHAELPIP